MNHSETKEERMFRRQGWYSIHPTLEETGIGIGGFKKPQGVVLNVDIGDFAVIHDDTVNDGIIVEVIKYAGYKPWWKGARCDEGEPSWIVKSLSRPFEVTQSDAIETLMMDKMPIQDRWLSRVDKPKTLAKE